MAETPPRKADSDGFTGDVVIEVGDERNRNIIWSPTKRELRGRWSRVNLTGDELVESLGMLPDIPGMHIIADGRRKRLVILDPLADPKNAELREKVSKIIKESWRREEGPEKTVIIENASDTQIKTWLFWMRRLVEGAPVVQERRGTSGGPQAKIVSGKLPSYEEIAALPGKTRIEFHNSSHRAVKFLEEATVINREG